MNRKSAGAVAVFAALLAVTIGGIIYHQLSGYLYPTAPAHSYEMNVLGDIYEAFVLMPLGLLAIWATRRQKTWGPLLIVGVSVHFAYNYGMAIMGRQNLWIFVWVAKFTLAALAIGLAWSLLPAGKGLSTRARWLFSIYMTAVAVIFTKLMGQRLLASATGRVVDMTMQQIGVVDWGEPILRDPIVFFSFALPLMIAAIIGCPQRTEWGSKAAAAMCAFITSMVAVILFTGPLMEALQTGRVSGPMLSMSAIFIAAVAPSIWFLIRLAKDRQLA